MDAPRQQVHVDYGLAHRLRGLTVDHAEYASQISYNAAGHPVSARVGGSSPHPLTETFMYDPWTGFLTHQQVQRARRAVLDLSYDYVRPGMEQGRTGQLTRMISNLDTQKSRTYTYDAVGRLTQVAEGPAHNPVWTQAYRYDEYGNRTSVTPTGSVPSDGLSPLRYDGTNRITTEGFAYDATGNLTRGWSAAAGARQYQYDAAGRLVQVLDETGRVLEVYTYGADNRRLMTQQGETANWRTYYVWNNEGVLAEYRETESTLATPQWVKSYIYWGRRLLASATPGGVRYHHPDQLSTRLIAQHADATVQEQGTLPFGEGEAEAAAWVNPIFTSYDRSATTGLDYALNRHYHPQLGRFLQVDPLGITAAHLESPQSLNLYTYVQNDPVNLIDPTGLGEQFCFIDNQDKMQCYEEIVVTAPSRSPALSWPGLRQAAVPRENQATVPRENQAEDRGCNAMGLQEAIYRVLGGRGPYTPAPRPTTQLDVLAAGMLVAPVAAVAAVRVAPVLATLGTSNIAIGLGVRTMQIGTNMRWARTLWALVPAANRMLGGDPRYGGSPGSLVQNLQTLGYSKGEIWLFQALHMARMAVQANPGFLSCGGM